MPTFQDVFLFRKFRYLLTAICFWYLIVYLLAVLGTMVLNHFFERYVSVDPSGFHAVVTNPPAILVESKNFLGLLMFPAMFFSLTFLEYGVLSPYSEPSTARYWGVFFVIVCESLLVFCFNLGIFAVADRLTRRGSTPTPRVPDHPETGS